VHVAVVIKVFFIKYLTFITVKITGKNMSLLSVYFECHSDNSCIFESNFYKLRIKSSYLTVSAFFAVI
jgi:hypothetical protein